MNELVETLAVSLAVPQHVSMRSQDVCGFTKLYFVARTVLCSVCVVIYQGLYPHIDAVRTQKYVKRTYVIIAKVSGLGL